MLHVTNGTLAVHVNYFVLVVSIQDEVLFAVKRLVQHFDRIEKICQDVIVLEDEVDIAFVVIEKIKLRDAVLGEVNSVKGLVVVVLVRKQLVDQNSVVEVVLQIKIVLVLPNEALENVDRLVVLEMPVLLVLRFLALDFVVKPIIVVTAIGEVTEVLVGRVSLQLIPKRARVVKEVALVVVQLLVVVVKVVISISDLDGKNVEVFLSLVLIVAVAVCKVALDLDFMISYLEDEVVAAENVLLKMVRDLPEVLLVVDHTLEDQNILQILGNL